MTDATDIAIARQIVRDGCDHPLRLPGQRPLYLGGWCQACDVKVRSSLQDDDPVWSDDE